MINGKKCDVFISYRRTEGWELAKIIYNSLKENHFNPFLDIEGIKTGDDWNNKIQTNLEEAKIFVLVVSRESISGKTLEKYAQSKDGDWVLKEIDYALSHNKIIIPVLSDGYSDIGTPENVKQIFSKQGLRININMVDQALDKMYKDIYGYLDKENASFQTVGRIDCQPGIVKANPEIIDKYKEMIKWNNYFEGIGAANDIPLSNFRKTIFKISAKYEEFSILDVGCGNYTSIWNLFKNSPKLKKYVGIDNDENWIKAGLDSDSNEYRNDFDLWLMDITDKDFLYKLYNEKIVANTYSFENMANIDSLSKDNRFEIVILKDVLRYVKDPQLVIEACKRALKPGGTIVIADIDDGLNIVYPDKEGIIQKFNSLLDDDKYDFGNRYTARQIFSYLSQAKLNNIDLTSSLLTNDKFNNFAEKTSKFENKYQLLKTSFEKRLALNKYDVLLKISYDWLQQNYQKILDEIRQPNTFMTESYIIFTATRDFDDEKY